jgi:hypothetical protein
MTATEPGEGLSASYIHDDPQRRQDFDHQLAAYLRSHAERWDLTAVLESLDLLGRRVGQIGVHMRRKPTGALSVTMTFELAPGKAARNI